MRCSARRNCARDTGSTGISGGCGKRSSRYSMMIRESYSTRSRSTSVGSVWSGLRSRRSSGKRPGVTLTISISTSFSARTMRVRWLATSSGAENRVITSGVTSMDVLPVFLLQHPRKPCEHQQEQDHPDAQMAPLRLRGVSRVVEEIHRVAHEAVELLRSQAALRQVFETLHGRTAAMAAGGGMLAEHRDLHALEV